MIERPEDALRVLAAERGDAIVVPTMTTAPAWRSLAPGDLSVTCVGFMGGASSLGLHSTRGTPKSRLAAEARIPLARSGAATIRRGNAPRAASASRARSSPSRSSPAESARYA